MRNTILIIEDCQLYQASLQKLAHDHGFTTETCCDGMEAIVRINQGVEKIVTIFLDINMPNIDGISLLGHLQSKHRDIPVIVISGFDQESSRKTCMELGAELFIEKPLDAAKIEAIFNSVKHTLAKAS